MRKLKALWMARRRELAYKQLEAERGMPPGRVEMPRAAKWNIDSHAHTTTEWKGD